MDRIEKGEVYLCELPYINEAILCGVRPCIIVSNNYVSSNADNVQVCPVTSTRKRMDLTCHVETNFGVAKVENLTTIPKRYIVKKEGKLTSKEMRQLDTAMLIQIGIL